MGGLHAVCEVLGIEKGAMSSGPVASFPCTIRFSHGTLRNPKILSMNSVFWADKGMFVMIGG